MESVMVTDPICYWDSDPPKHSARVEEIGHFDARGARRVYGRGDKYLNHRTYNMEIWLNKSGELLMRCWSRSKFVTELSLEIGELDISKITDIMESQPFKDSWIPQEVRDSYEEWIDDAMFDI